MTRKEDIEKMEKQIADRLKACSNKTACSICKYKNQSDCRMNLCDDMGEEVRRCVESLEDDGK